MAKRALTAPPAEWHFRLRQCGFAARNLLASKRQRHIHARRGHLRSLGLQPNSLSRWWAHREANWFLNEQRIRDIRGAGEEPESFLPWVIEQADLVVNGKLPLFSLGPVDFDHPQRWHHDPILKKTAPLSFYGAIPYLNANVVGDHKFVWEPNRCAWAMWLGIAYRATSHPKYANVFFEWLDDWFQRNPYPMGINYCSALEIGLRNYAWLWALNLFATEWHQHIDLLNQLVANIWMAGHHIENNLSTYFSPNTHLTGEAFALFATGAALPEFKESHRWRWLGLDILRQEASRQFYRDGMHRELSTGYHLYSTDFYLQSILIGQETGYTVPVEIVDTTTRMIQRIQDMVTVDLTLPAMNDCDGGRVLSLVPDPLDAAPTLFAAQDVFGHNIKLRHSRARCGYALLMQPNSHRRRIGSTPSRLPHFCDNGPTLDSGIATYRTAEDDLLIFRASDFGYLDCPHSHNAHLGIQLHLKGQPIFVDSGTGSYTQDLQRRNYFRAAGGKNAPLLNGVGTAVPDSWFGWKSRTDSQLTTVQHFDDGFLARGKFAVQNAAHGAWVYVQREVVVLNFGIIVITDRWDCTDEVSYCAPFLVHPDLSLDSAQQMLIHSSLNVHFAAAALDPKHDLRFTQSFHPYSKNYGHESKTSTIAHKIQPCRRGGIVTAFSRSGRIQVDRQRMSLENSEFEVNIAKDGVNFARRNRRTTKRTNPIVDVP